MPGGDDGVTILRMVRFANVVVGVFVMFAAADKYWIIGSAVAMFVIEVVARMLQTEVERSADMCLSSFDDGRVLHSCVLPPGHKGGHRYCCEDREKTAGEASSGTWGRW